MLKALRRILCRDLKPGNLMIAGSQYHTRWVPPYLAQAAYHHLQADATDLE